MWFSRVHTLVYTHPAPMPAWDRLLLRYEGVEFGNTPFCID